MVDSCCAVLRTAVRVVPLTVQDWTAPVPVTVISPGLPLMVVAWRVLIAAAGQSPGSVSGVVGSPPRVAVGLPQVLVVWLSPPLPMPVSALVLPLRLPGSCQRYRAFCFRRKRLAPPSGPALEVMVQVDQSDPSGDSLARM